MSEVNPRTAQALMSTKTIPPRTVGVIQRDRLATFLERSRNARLTLVSAPAGSGKTTLLSGWFGAGCEGSCWLTLDDRDSDPVRFLRYCVAALRDVVPILPDPDVVDGETDPWLITIVNSITAHGAEVVLVLDDYHAIRASSVHAILQTLVTHAPANLHVVVSTRVDPPFPLSLLRGRGELVELRADDLRFSNDEIASAASHHGLELDAELVSRIADRTGGWCVGVRLTLDAVRRSSPSTQDALEDTFGPRTFHRFVADEVLDRLDDETAHVVAQLAPLGRVCEGLAAAILGESCPHRLTDFLLAQNLVVDAVGPWLRFPEPIVELTRRRLDSRSPGETSRVHRAAARWFLENAEPFEAAAHLRDAGDHDAAAEILERIADDAQKNTDVIEAARLASSLSAESVRRRPLLCVYLAVAEIVGAEPTEAFGAWLAAAAASDTDGRFDGERAAPLAVVQFFAGDLPRAKAAAQRALRRVPDRRRLLRVLSLSALAVVKMWEGDVRIAIDIAKEALEIGRSMGNAFVECAVSRRMLEAAFLAGDAEYAATVFDALRARYVDRPYPFCGFAYLTYADVLLAQYRLDEAYAVANTGHELVDGWDPAVLSGPTLTIARIADARGDVPGAHALFVQAVRYASDFTLTRLDERYVGAYVARFRIRTGEYDGAWEWAAACGFSSESPFPGRAAQSPNDVPLLDFLETLTFARLLAATEACTEAPATIPRVIESIIEPLRANGLVPFELEATLLLALAADRRGDAGVTSLIESAVRLAAPRRLVLLFIELGDDVARLLYRHLEETSHRDFVAALLAAFPTEDRASAYRVVRDAGVTPLSPRELEILSLLADGLSNKELADAAFVSLATIKWHTSNIYTKLGVKSRIAAVSKARSLGLISA